jgi:leucine dehydrogenase
MHAVAEHRWGDASLERKHVVVSGVGKVGGALVELLAHEQVRLTIADLNTSRVADLAARFGAEAVAPDVAHTVPCEIFSPCAYGAVLSARSIPELRCAAVVGAANNQLAEPDDAGRLASAGILYVPDFVANAGGVINIAEELHGYDQQRARDAVAHIRETTAAVLHTAAMEGIGTEEAAERLAEVRIMGARDPVALAALESTT